MVGAVVDRLGSISSWRGTHAVYGLLTLLSQCNKQQAYTYECT